MEIYNVWATFNLKGDALQKMERFSLLVNTADQKVKSLNRTIDGVSMRMARLSKNLLALNPELSKLSSSFSGLNTHITSGKDKFSSFNNSLSTTIARTNKAAAGAEQLARSLAKVSINAQESSASLGGVRMMGGGGGGRRSGFHKMHGLGAVGMGFMGEPLGLMASAATFGAPFAAIAGAGLVASAGYSRSNEYNRLLGQLSALGYTPDQVSKVNSYIGQTSILGASKLQILQAYIDAQMATREKPGEAVGRLSEVKEFTPILAKSQVAANLTYGGMSVQEEQNLIRFAEIMGGSSMDRRKKFLDVAAQIMVSSGGSIRPTELRTFARQAGGSFSHLTPEALVGLEPLFQEMGGAKMATGLVTGLRQLVTGTGSNFNKKQIEFLQSIGLLSATFDNQGRPLGVKMPQQYERIASTDPFKFLTEVIMPLLKKKGITSEEGIASALTLGFSRTYSNELQIMLKNSGTIQRQLDQLHGIGGVESQYQMAIKKGYAAPTILSAAWSDFAKAIGDLTSPTVNAGLVLLARGLETLATFFSFFSKDKEGREQIRNMQATNVSALYSNSGILTAFSKGVESATANVARTSNYFALENYGDYGSFSRNSFSKYGGITDSVHKSSATPTTVNLHMNAEKVASAILPNLTNSMSMGGVTSGTAYTNIGLNPISTNYNTVGSP